MQHEVSEEAQGWSRSDWTKALHGSRCHVLKGEQFAEDFSSWMALTLLELN